MTEVLTWSDDVRKVATPLLWTVHARLADFDIRWAFSDKKVPSKITCKSYAQIGICNPRERLLASGEPYSPKSYTEKPADVLIVLNKALWDSLEPRQQTAVVDHSLEHLEVDDDDALSLRDHDLAEFAGVLERNGVYFESMSYAAQVIFDLGAKAVNRG